MGQPDPQSLLSKFNKLKKTSSGYQARCPAHEDKTASLSISLGNDGRLLLHCHAGCDIDAILSGADIEKRELFPERQKPTISNEYNYTDADGKLLYQVVRYDPKDFRQRRPDGNGWAWSLKGVNRVLYRLPEVTEAAASGCTVFVCEGEKDADRLASLGFTATCNAGGADKWHSSYSASLANARVIILPDHDGPGRAHAERIKRDLPDSRIVWLPGLTEKQDVSDWLAAGNDPATIASLPDGVPPEPAKAEPVKTEQPTTVAAALTAGAPTDQILDMISRVESFGAREEFVSRICGERNLPKVQTRKHVNELAIHRAKQRGSVAQARNPYGLNLDGLRWTITGAGVFPLTDKSGVWEPMLSSPAATRPVWPQATGTDAATGRTYVKLQWKTPDGSSWLPESALCDKQSLFDIDGLPVSIGRVSSLSDWLADSTPRAPETGLDITSQYGWVKRKWAWTDSDITYIGAPLAEPGNLEKWLTGLRHLLELGEAGYPALVCLMASAGAPLVRLVGRRNPVFGLVSRTSTGKGSAINYALSLWTDASTLSLPASSTIKGAQDRALQLPDLPIFADEIHQLEQDGIARMLYFLGNGQRRVTSSRAQRAVGGQRRWGVSFYAAEHELLSGSHGGVLTRAIEIDTAPCPDQETSLILQQAARYQGALAMNLSALLTPKLMGTIAEYEKCIQSTAGGKLRGDDVSALAVVWVGGKLLSEAADLPSDWTDAVTEWLIGQHIEGRESRVDSVEAAWRGMMDVVLNSEIVGTEFTELRHVISRETLAWIGPPMDINTRHPRIAEVLNCSGGELLLLPEWDNRGWLVRQGKHRKTRRRDAGRVLRVSEDAPDAVMSREIHE